MLRWIKYIFTAVLLSLLLWGCAELFEFNLFENLDKVEMPDIDTLKNEMSTDEMLDYLSDEFNSQAFFDALTYNPDTYAKIETFLEDVWSGGESSPEQKQRSRALYADLFLYTTPAGEAAANAAAALMDPDFDFSGTSVPIEEALSNFLAFVVPAEALSSEEAFGGMIDAFVAADSAYQALAAVLTDPPDEGLNMGQIAQNAVISHVVFFAFSESSVPELYQLAQGDLSGESLFTNPFEPMPSHVDGILQAAGLEDTFTW